MEVGFERFSWDQDATVFTDGAALCVGFPVAVGGAAAYQVSVGPTGVTTVRSMSLALPIGYRVSSGAAERVAMNLACMGGKQRSYLLGVGQCGRGEGSSA